ncbi:MAG: phenylacetic acid degradation protein [Armatimonadetes bacterium]|nr:phenylacetic acid degradation protein [Armatimonadota bacterium]
MRKLVGIVLLSTAICATAAAQPVFDYVNAPDDAYAWEETGTRTIGGQTKLTELQLTSQMWRGIRWTHRLQIITPPNVRYPETAMLIITGGAPGQQEQNYLAVAANMLSAPVVVLGDIPNQPLFDGLTEDNLIAYTFDQYLTTEESDWPLLFPMTKAAVRAMDAVEEYTAEVWDTPVSGFYVTGASKRGWTTWFTAVVAPQRCVGIAPMVYDNLNLSAQMTHQVETWGDYSERISEYTERGLPQRLAMDSGRRLGEIVDPYTYRARATMPKLIISGTNDPYWPLDAANLYFEELPRPRYLLYVPNCGHGLEDTMRVISAHVGFFAACTGQVPLPQLDWRYQDGRHLELVISSQPAPQRVVQWTATSPTRDFREVLWQQSPARPHKGQYIARIHYPDQGYRAIFAEAVYDFSGKKLPLCTQVRIIGPR